MRASGRVIGENIEEVNEIPTDTEEQQLYTLPGVKKDREGKFSAFFALDIYKLWQPCKNMVATIKATFDTWFGTDNTSGIQKQWKDLKEDAVAATNTARNAAGTVQDAIDHAESAASTANTAAGNADTSRLQIEAKESERQQQEGVRESNEAERKQNETQRQQAESQRQSTFSSNEALRQQTFDTAEQRREQQFTTVKQEAVDATALAQDVALHPTYVDGSGWVYEYNSTTKTYNKTDKNIHGRNFVVDKVFQSVTEMNAYTGSLLEEGRWFLVNTGSVEDEDTAKLYIVQPAGGQLKPVFLVDMSGARGFTGHTPQFSIGTVTTGSPGTSAQATISDDGTDPVTGDPKFKLNLVIPKGDPLRWADLTAEQISELQRPATEAATEIRTEWKGTDGNGGLKKTITDWYNNTTSTWSNWFSDSLADGVRKKWNDFWSNINTRWENFFGEENGTPTKGVQKTWTDWFSARGTEWSGWGECRLADWTQWKADRLTDWDAWKDARLEDWGAWKNGRLEDFYTWLSARLSEWNTWWDGRKTEWQTWFTNGVVTDWESWFSDTITTGIRKVWSDWFGARQDDWSTLEHDATEATDLAIEKAGYANTQGDYAKTQGDRSKDFNDHPPYIADGTAQKPGVKDFWYIWNETDGQYVKDAYSKGDNLHYGEMSQQEKDDLAQTVLSTLVIASEETCEALLNELT